MSLLPFVTDQRMMSSVGAYFRKRRAKYITSLIEGVYARNGQCRILDIGGEALYWKMFDPAYLRARRVHITITNIEYDPDMAVEADPALFTIDTGNGCRLAYPDQSFDLVHSNSVIEHVGRWPDMVAFAAECRRLAPQYYVQMPYFWFPVEPHFGMPFFHWLPEPMRVYLVTRFALGRYPKADTVSRANEWVQSCHLLGRSQFKHLFPDAVIASERVAGMTKSLIAMKPA
jgi:hypothetical protein